jgi:tetratricopeptide (TPR) repeat protein
MNLAIIAGFLIAATAPRTAEQAFQAGNQLMEARMYCEALRAYRAGLTIDPVEAGLLYNGGLAALQCRDFAVAVDLMSQLKKLDPDDWQVRAKLVQTYQALGKIAERDKERADLFDLRKRGSNQDLSKQAEYCRERFEAGGEKVMAWEYFELTGERAVKYVFDVMNETDDRAKYRISLGSYDLTNNIWHQRTQPAPPPDVRLFHLDGYWENGHATYAMLPGEPSYDEVRALVVKILKKELTPVSTTITSQPAPTKQ